MSQNPASPSDEDLRKIGLSDHQIELLEGWDNLMRQEVYNEAIRLLMERPSGYDGLHEDLNL